MLEKSIDSSSNLVASDHHYPFGMLHEFAKRYPDQTRKALQDLVNGSEDVGTRTKNYISKMDELLEMLHAAGDGAKNHFQNASFASVLLAFSHPDRYYIYKYTVLKDSAKKLDLKVPGNAIARMTFFFNLCDELKRYLDEDSYLVNRSDVLLREDLRKIDPEHHILVQDILFITSGNQETPQAEKRPTQAASNTASKYWWLCANPKRWDPVADIEPGEEQSYTIRNESGNPRRIHKHFLEAEPGDQVVVYTSSPIRKVTSLFEISQPRTEDEIFFRKVRDFPVQPTLEQLRTYPKTKNAEPMHNGQGSLFHLTKQEFDAISALAEGKVTSKGGPERYDRNIFLREVLMEPSDLDDLEWLLENKKNIILAGAPGTGKTFAARRLAWEFMGCKDDDRIVSVQFHQSYSYEDFVMGYRPTSNGGFTPQNGPLIEACDVAKAHPGEKCFLIIDEINRADISKVLGELLVLLEADKRGESHTVSLIYQNDDEGSFYVPENLMVIGMMNTADRSIALMDYALRRRFAFFEMTPAFGLEGEHEGKRLKSLVSKLSVSDKKLGESLIEGMRRLNTKIANDPELGPGFCIGHSYFFPPETDRGDERAWLRRVITYEIGPLLREYWFDDLEKAEIECKALLDVVKV